MFSGISKKVISFSFLFINFLQPSKSAELIKINKNINNQNTNFRWSDNLNEKILSSTSKIFNDNTSYVNLLNKNFDAFLVAKAEKQQDLILESNKQSEINNVIYAEGNVIVSYRGKLLKADNLIYDKLNKKISARGNVKLISGDQIFKASKLEYSFISEKGYLLDVKGSINTNKLMDDLSSNFSFSDSKKIASLFGLKKKEVLHTPEKVENWLFLTDKMTIEGEKWMSKKAIFSNDLLELKQVKFAINSLEVVPYDDKLRFKSSINYLIFEEKVSIPFYLGDRTINKSGNFFDFESRWNLGYEKLDKDGYFIGRKFNSIAISDDYFLDLEPQYLIQRSIQGYTKSFVKKDASITSEKIKRNTSFEDYFALKSQIQGKISDWDLAIEKNLNSFNLDSFSDAFRLKANLNKEINFLNSKWEKSFYGVYRDRVWNGSLGEAEIYTGFGSKLKKENTWFVNGIEKTESLSLGLGQFTAEALNTNNLITKYKGNFFYKFDQKFPIYIKEPKNKSIDISYRYNPEKITKGLNLKTRLEASYSFYENGNHQEYLALGAGPELILGNYKKKTFDYTRVSLLPFYKIKNGESVFKFDQNYDNLTINIAFDQQLFGPVIIKSKGTLNLTSSSSDYGEFINSLISLNWRKRTYEIGVFYQPHNQAGGINFSLFGFK
ncbi:MAG: DUF3769 domain-containing protein [Prochlorococcus marinus CUG1436]|nr:DUF3769 domain-containing protein [Prochlorococcus marinus CUG1436]